MNVMSATFSFCMVAFFEKYHAVMKFSKDV